MRCSLSLIQQLRSSRSAGMGCLGRARSTDRHVRFVWQLRRTPERDCSELDGRARAYLDKSTAPAYVGSVRPELPDAHHTWGLAAEGPRRKECFTERRPHSPGCRYPAARRSNPTCRAPGTMG